MVTVTDYNFRQSKEGDKPHYISLELEGEIEMVQSQASGRFYATVRRCNISSTFDELTAERMVGKQMPGTIERVPCEPYDFTIPESGEVVRIGYRWDYVPERAMRMHSMKAKASTQPADQTGPGVQDEIQEEPVLDGQGQ